MTERTIDFDAFRREAEREPLLLKVGGKEFELPPAIPADLALKIIRMNKELGPDGEFPPERMEEFGNSLFGEAVFDELVHEQRLDLNELGELIKQTMAVYQADASPPPNRASRRAGARRPSTTTSSKTGR